MLYGPNEGTLGLNPAQGLPFSKGMKIRLRKMTSPSYTAVDMQMGTGFPQPRIS